ncbi:hypothetical protein FB479_101568 [Brevibacillus sp. AG162]|uniref:hypothetical protein n=1 Tax=Brevibacillus sp. AG162 TaxID=2572910 RepID=UPI001170B9CD|nr:hypothetical protein [Brevibacillus sp. AG162]TQK74957.1 hypothetical protein FB479_101568 [Brevibacillus sp. AG162]
MLWTVILSQEQATSALGRYRLSLINDAPVHVEWTMKAVGLPSRAAGVLARMM